MYVWFCFTVVITVLCVLCEEYSTSILQITVMYNYYSVVFALVSNTISLQTRSGGGMRPWVGGRGCYKISNYNTSDLSLRNSVYTNYFKWNISNSY